MNVFNTYYKYIVLIFGFTFLYSCKDDVQVAKPKNLIEEHQMGVILGDFLLIENFNNHYVSNNDSVDFNQLQLYTYPVINEKYQLSDSQAFHSYNYYLQFPDKMKNIISIAQDSLNKLVEKTTIDAKN